MANPVVIKANKYGIVIHMDENASFDDIKNSLIERFAVSNKFFDNANIALSFEGRQLSAEQEREILDIISEKSDLNIVCVIDDDKSRENYFNQVVDKRLEQMSSNTGQFYKGTLRSGQVYEQESSIIILGDVNPGARVISNGNVVVLGNLKGYVYAGANGNQNAFVVALEMNPQQIRIGDVIARSNEDAKPKTAKELEPKIAFVDDNNIYIEKLDKNVLSDIKI